MQPADAEGQKVQPLLHPGCEPPRDLIRRQKNAEHFISSVSKVIRNQLSLRAVRQDNRVPLRNPNFPSGHDSKQTEGKEKSVLEISKIFPASVLQKSLCASADQTACLLCVQTRDKHCFLLLIPCPHLRAFSLFFNEDILSVSLSLKLQKECLPSKADPEMALETLGGIRLGVWEETDFVAECRWREATV